MDDFFDEDEPESPEQRRSSRRGAAGPARGDELHPARQQIMTRRLTAVAGAIVFIILASLAIKGCLDSRAERAFKDYVSDLSAIAVETGQVSDDFFAALAGDPAEGDVSVANQVNGARGSMQALLDRVRNLDAPDEVKTAQARIELAYDLRLEGLTVISEQLPTALGNAGAKKATREIAAQMRTFLAGDVLYASGAKMIDAELAAQEIVVDGGVPSSVFLPVGKNDPDYLDADQIASLLGGSGSTTPTGDPNDGLRHGLGLVSSTLLPGGAALTEGVTATVDAASSTEIEVQVQNQGEATESEIKVTISGDFSGTQTISTIDADETQSVTIPLKPTPGSGDSGTITVEVATVPGEQVAENNTATYDVVFE